ncbi:MAG: GGDEF domain-containing protein [Campylobacterota bacterium]|nr:GGDEF domain-containing protein [Campylobacterota bacterium]
MTGIYNRRKFFSLATQVLDDSKESLYVVIIDIDKLKKINDTYGHHAGDEVIKIVAKTINEKISNDEIFGRVGGEEFALICRANSKEDIINSIEAIREDISQLEVVLDGNIMKFTISGGDN